MVQGDDDAEWRKRLTAALLPAPALLLLDNLTGDLDNPALSMILTTGYVLDWLLGKTQEVTFKTTTVFLGTGNNVTLVGDMVRRHIPVRLDAGVEKPWVRVRDKLVIFAHPRLRAWVLAHRGDLLAAALTVIRAWVAKGRPLSPATMGSYESWAEVLGGVLGVAHRPGFLSTLDEAYESVDPEQDATKRFVRLWWATFRAKPLVGLDPAPDRVRPDRGPPARREGRRRPRHESRPLARPARPTGGRRGGPARGGCVPRSPASELDPLPRRPA